MALLSERQLTARGGTKSPNTLCYVYDYLGELLTLKELAQKCDPPISRKAMEHRVSKGLMHGLSVYDVVHNFSCLIPRSERKKSGKKTGRKAVTLFHEGRWLTYRELGVMATTPCSGETMRYRVKRCGCIYKALTMKPGNKAKSFEGTKIEYKGEPFTYKELGSMARVPCSGDAMRRRIRKHGSVEAAISHEGSRAMIEITQYSNPARALYVRNLIKGKHRKGFSFKDVYEIGEGQGWKCSLSGIDMTHEIRNGGCGTNISIDRIVAGGPYTKENIRLVCRVINSFRCNTSTEDFIYYCTCVANHNKKELKIASQAS